MKFNHTMNENMEENFIQVWELYSKTSFKGPKEESGAESYFP